jgi:hypothetical protein
MVATFTAAPLTIPDGWVAIHTEVIAQMICQRREWVPEREHATLNTDVETEGFSTWAGSSAVNSMAFIGALFMSVAANFRSAHTV